MLVTSWAPNSRKAHNYFAEFDEPWVRIGMFGWIFEEHWKGRLNISLDGNAPSFEETANQNSKMEKDCDSVRLRKFSWMVIPFTLVIKVYVHSLWISSTSLRHSRSSEWVLMRKTWPQRVRNCLKQWPKYQISLKHYFYNKRNADSKHIT